MSDFKPAFFVGDPVPWFACRSSNNPEFNFDTAGGRYLVLSFFGSAKDKAAQTVLDGITGSMRSLFDDDKLAFFGISIDPEDEQQGRVKQQNPGIRFFWDFECKVSRLYRALAEEDVEGTSLEHRLKRYQPHTLILDPFMRVIGVLSFENPEKHVALLEHFLKTLEPVDEHAGVPSHAPVMVIPRIFEPSFCKRLIAVYERHGGGASGFMREKDGNTVGMLDNKFKRRKDYRLDTDVDPENKELCSMIRARIKRRLIPAIQQCFQYDATHIERYIVACYEGTDQGFFRTHRDNTTRGTAHRRFAVTINLNAEEYEGGNLRFPEFGTKTYRAPTGGAVVFSCSLLHEATPVTSGTRYAFLPFIYDEAAAKVRQENMRYLTGEMVDLNAGAL